MVIVPFANLGAYFNPATHLEFAHTAFAEAGPAGNAISCRFLLDFTRGSPLHPAHQLMRAIQYFEGASVQFPPEIVQNKYPTDGDSGSGNLTVTAFYGGALIAFAFNDVRMVFQADSVGWLFPDYPESVTITLTGAKDGDWKETCLRSTVTHLANLLNTNEPGLTFFLDPAKLKKPITITFQNQENPIHLGGMRVTHTPDGLLFANPKKYRMTGTVLKEVRRLIYAAAIHALMEAFPDKKEALALLAHPHLRHIKNKVNFDTGLEDVWTSIIDNTNAHGLTHILLVTAYEAKPESEPLLSFLVHAGVLESV